MAEAEASATRTKLEEAKELDAQLSGEHSLPVTELPRGGVYVETSVGPIQFGMPPETIKDSMSLGLAIARHFVVPSERFNRQMGPSMGINVAEFEFPAYVNFFFKRQSVNLIVDSPEVERDIRTVFQETLLGPEEWDPEADFTEAAPREQRADLPKEMDFFRKFGDKLMTIDMLLSFTHFSSPEGGEGGEGGGKTDEADGEPVATLTDDEGHEVRLVRVGDFVHVYDNGELGARVPDRVVLRGRPQAPESAALFTFKPPRFGVTVLGRSHGFDPTGSTSGYVLWINHHGIMIDPPPQVSSMLQDYHIPPSLIDSVIVTHCHADHDAGAFQKILLENKVMLMTTPTIYGSFLRKYSALSGLRREFLERAFRFRPVHIGEDVRVRGGVFKFFYTLHSIPCVGFEVFFGGKSMVFSADHMNDAPKIRELHELGVLSDGRRDALLSFPWNHDLIFHEAGVPPIHTPMDTLQALPDDVKERLYVVHVAGKDIPEGSGLRSAPLGVENTVELDIEEAQLDQAAEVLDMLHLTMLFSHAQIDVARELVQTVTAETVAEGTELAAQGAGIDKVFIITSGKVTASDGRQLGRGDTLGEASVVDLAATHPIGAVASTAVDLLWFQASTLHYLMADTHVRSLLSSLQDTSPDSVWESMRCNSVLGHMSSAQQHELEAHMRRRPFRAGEVIWRANEPAYLAVLVHAGTLTFDLANGAPIPNTPRGTPFPSHRSFGRGAFVAEVEQIMANDPATTTLVAETDGVLFDIPYTELKAFWSGNPGILLAMFNSHYTV